jgi:hypothetical protein
MQLIHTFVLVDSVEKLLFRLLNHSNLVIIIDEVAQLFEVCRKRWIVWQTGGKAAEHSDSKLR